MKRRRSWRQIERIKVLQLERERERQLLGSHGAASEVRRIDPTTYQPQQPRLENRRPAA